MWTAPHSASTRRRTRRKRTFNQPSPSAVPKRLQRACNVPLPEHAEHLKIGGAVVRISAQLTPIRRGISAGAVRCLPIRAVATA